MRPGEIPRFGSVWQWGSSDFGPRLLALGIIYKSNHANLVAVVVGLRTHQVPGWPSPAGRVGEIDNSFVWSDGYTGTLDGWICIDEGPDL